MQIPCSPPVGPTSLIYSPSLRSSPDSALYSRWGVYVLFPRGICPDCFFRLESSFAAIRTLRQEDQKFSTNLSYVWSLKPA